jgi:hypothetical protein
MRFRSRVVVTAGVAVILGLLLAASPAVAECDRDNSIFEDEFEFLDPSWGATADHFYVEDGALVVKSYWGQVNTLTQNEAANVCVDMTIVDAPAPENSPIGLVWWWENWDNYYYLFYWPDVAYVEVRRLVKGQSQTLLSLDTLALKKGIGQTNHVEMQLRPKDATLIINGTQVTRFKGKPPKGGGSIGVYATSPEDQPATYKFDNLVVSAPSE